MKGLQDYRMKGFTSYILHLTSQNYRIIGLGRLGRLGRLGGVGVARGEGRVLFEVF